MTKKKKRNDIVILGAGLAGLSTALHLKDGYSVFEKEREAGGMVRSIHQNGYTFDYDGHLLHFRKEYTFKLVSGLLNGNLAPHKRDSWIYSNNTFTRYPFQANFYGLPKSVVKDCLIGLIRARAEGATGKVALTEDFASWIKRIFGFGIAEHFMLPYNKKFWKVDPSELTCEWLDGFVPVPTIEDTVSGAISDNIKPYGYNARFWYPVRGGISELSRVFLDKISNVYFNKKAVRLDQYKREIVFRDGTRKKFRSLISTIPLPELFRLLVDLPLDVRQAFSKLRFTSIFVVNLGIQRDDLIDRHWVYYPEDSVVFYRIGFPTNFSIDVAPSKRTSVYAEISYSGNKKIDRNRMTADTVRDLGKVGIISDKSEIEVCLPVDIKYGYVIYDLNRKSAVKVIKDYLGQFGIRTIGRYGSWRYMSMEDVIVEGKETAEQFVT